jgi:GTPase
VYDGRQPAGPGGLPLAELTTGRRAVGAQVGHNADMDSHARPHRSGFGCLVGRPNVGKSTLVNALVGQKVAITSGRPQTTRHTIRGIVHRPDAQLIVVDTPGLHKPKTLLGERLDDVVRQTWAEVDVVALCIPADEKVGPGDRFIARQLAEQRRTPVFGVVTKTDRVAPDVVADRLVEVSSLGEFAEILPVSAQAGFQVDLLADLLIDRLPEGPPLYPDGDLTDEPEQVMIAEFVREAALEGVRDELPHSIAVTVDEMSRRPDRDMVDIYATVFVERPSQKAIVLGPGAARLRDVGTTARRQIEALLGSRVYLNLHVTVLKDWQRDPKHLRRLGF